MLYSSIPCAKAVCHAAATQQNLFLATAFIVYWRGTVHKPEPLLPVVVGCNC
jgi:hypothetical protein